MLPFYLTMLALPIGIILLAIVLAHATRGRED